MISIWPLRKTWLSTWWQNPWWQSQTSTFGNSNLQLPPQIFYGIQTGSRILMCFFLTHSFVALAVCFGSSSCWNTNPRPIFNALALTVHGPVHRPFDAVQLSCPLSRKTPPKHNVSTSMFDGGDGVLGVIGRIPSPPNKASWVDAKELDFGLIWPQHFHTVLLWIIDFSRAVHVLYWAGGPCGRCRISVLHGV